MSEVTDASFFIPNKFSKGCVLYMKKVLRNIRITQELRPRNHARKVSTGSDGSSVSGTLMQIAVLLFGKFMAATLPAEEGSVGLPPCAWSNLFPSGAPKTSLIEVRYVWLPKGIYAKLKPDELGFSDIPNHKAVLETGLRQHATLSQDDVLTVNHGTLTYHLHVLELKPSSSVSVLETDIEVDIVGPDSALERTNQHVLLR